MRTIKINPEFKQKLNDNQENIIIGASVLTGATAGYFYAKGMTTIILGATAHPSAIATANVVINGTPMVASKIAAGMFSKIIVGGCVALAVGYGTYKLIQLINNSLNK